MPENLALGKPTAPQRAPRPQCLGAEVRCWTPQPLAGTCWPCALARAVAEMRGPAVVIFGSMSSFTIFTMLWGTCPMALKMLNHM